MHHAIRKAVLLLISFAFLLPLMGEEVRKAEPVQAETPRSESGKDKSFKPTEDLTAATSVRWCGHAFVYLTTSTGVRIAIDPFGEQKVKYLFPGHLPADVILISSEAEEHSAGERLFGSPQVFRSVTAVGINKANGFLFKGVEVYQTPRRSPGASRCTAFVFKVDGLTFAHLGNIGDTLDTRQKDEIGPVDVLFLPIGNPNLSVSDLNKIADDLQAKVIVPIAFKTSATGSMELRSRDEYLANQVMAVKKIDAIEFPISRSLIPDQPTIFVLNIP